MHRSLADGGCQDSQDWEAAADGFVVIRAVIFDFGSALSLLHDARVSNYSQTRASSITIRTGAFWRRCSYAAQEK